MQEFLAFLKEEVTGLTQVEIHTPALQFGFQLHNVDVFGPNLEFVFKTLFSESAWDVLMGLWVCRIVTPYETD